MSISVCIFKGQGNCLVQGHFQGRSLGQSRPQGQGQSLGEGHVQGHGRGRGQGQCLCVCGCMCLWFRQRIVC